ncbi:MAG: hypothetical protein SFV17_21235 [Candidatus Obscuribacter sp.]|nr:hypothetical protein [Candidatus Obscuribacter sp.]
MSHFKLLALPLCLFLTVGCSAKTPPREAAPQAHSSQIRQEKGIALLNLQELNDSNSEELILKSGKPSFVVVYSSKESSPAQEQQLEQIVRDSHNYTGAVNFYRLDQAKYPNTWSNISNGRPWSQGPCFLMVSINPLMIGTVMEQQSGIDVPLHTISSGRMSAEIQRFFKIPPLVTHINADNVDQLVLNPGLPTFIMVYRNSSPQRDLTQFHRFVYESQLYKGRVGFVYIDLDQLDLSSKLGLSIPQQGAPYYLLYNPQTRKYQVINNPTLSGKEMEMAISQFFGPGHEPAKVIYQ